MWLTPFRIGERLAYAPQLSSFLNRAQVQIKSADCAGETVKLLKLSRFLPRNELDLAETHRLAGGPS
jgi:hypothetical protein